MKNMIRTLTLAIGLLVGASTLATADEIFPSSILREDHPHVTATASSSASATVERTRLENKAPLSESLTDEGVIFPSSILKVKHHGVEEPTSSSYQPAVERPEKASATSDRSNDVIFPASIYHNW